MILSPLFLPRSLGVSCQLPPLSLVDAWAGQAGGAATGGETTLGLQTLAQLFATSWISHYHPAGRHQDDHWTTKGAGICTQYMATNLQSTSLRIYLFFPLTYIYSKMYTPHVTPSIVLTLSHAVFRVWKQIWSGCTSWWQKISSTAAPNPSSTGSCSSPSAFFTASYLKGKNFYSWAGILYMVSTILISRLAPLLILKQWRHSNNLACQSQSVKIYICPSRWVRVCWVCTWMSMRRFPGMHWSTSSLGSTTEVMSQMTGTDVF